MASPDRVARFDRGELAPPVELPNGWLKVEGKIARVGLQEYEDADGGRHVELRLPEEVFDPRSLESFQLVPVTNDHPPVMLDALNTSHYQVGQSGERIVRDGDFVRAPLMLTKHDAIVAVRAGRSELSNGYTCRLDPTQDESLIAAWGAYDYIQREIRGNHIALVDAARAGPEARLRLDSGAARMVDRHASRTQPPPAPPERTRMTTKFIIDGKPIDLDAQDAQEQIALAVNAVRDRAIAAERKRGDTLKSNGQRAVEIAKRLAAAFDAMKARMVPCEECGGSGKVTTDAGEAGAVCGYCDGTGSYRMHDAIKAMSAQSEGEESDELDELEAAAQEAGELDADELEEAPEPAAGKKSDAKRTKAIAAGHADRRAMAKARRDSRDRALRRAMQTRLDLELVARRYLDESDVPAADLAKMDNAGVMKAVVMKLAPTAKLDGRSVEQIRARYEAELERGPAFTVHDAAAMALRALPNLGAPPAAQRRDNDPQAARAAYLKRLDEQAKRGRIGAGPR